MDNKIVIINFSAAFTQEDCIEGKNTGAYYYSTQKNLLLSYLESRFNKTPLFVIGFNKSLKLHTMTIRKTKIIKLPSVGNLIVSSFLFNLLVFVYLFYLKPSFIYAYTDGLLYPYISSSIYSKLLKVPYFVDLRNPPYSVYIPKSAPLYKRYCVEFIDCICLNCSSVIIHVSKYAKELMQPKSNLYQKSIVVSSCSSSISYDNKNFHENKGINFATWSVINKPRKLDVVIRAFQCAQQLNSDFDAKFFIIGDGDDLENLKKLANDLQIKNIVFKGYMKQYELFDFLNKHVSVSVIPIPPENTYYLVSSPLKLAESISLGIPIIASNIQPNNIVKEYNLGILCEHDVKSYAKAFLEFWNSSESKLNIFRENCKKIQYMFKPEYIFNEVGDLIESQLKNC